jgi:hypothetical protein
MKMETETERVDRLVLQAVRHPDLYARKVSVLENELGVSSESIVGAAARNSALTTFTHGNELYIGLIERKAAYERDAEEGINPFEPNYRGDPYRATVLGGKPRFSGG